MAIESGSAGAKPTGSAEHEDAGDGGQAGVPTAASEPTQRSPHESGPKWWRRKGVLAALATVGVLSALYGLDLLLSQGEMPRGVAVSGVDIGGLNRAEAEQRLREVIEPRLRRPLPVAVGEVRSTIDPGSAKIVADWAATLNRAGDQPLNPWTRLASLFTTRSFDVVVSGDERRIAAELEVVRRQVEREPVEGSIRFEGTTPVPVDPVAGKRLDIRQATEAVLRGWAFRREVSLEVEAVPVKATAAGVRAALERLARPAVSGPITVKGEVATATVDPATIAEALTFNAVADGGLAPDLDPVVLREAVGHDLAGTERSSRDARMTFPRGAPTVEPGIAGRRIDWGATAAELLPVLTRPANRVVVVRYEDVPPRLTAEQVNQLGITEVIGEFTTEGFATDSGVNIRRVAEEVNGAIVGPGETFSLNGYTGPRGEEQGYVEAGVIEDGVPARAVGGGISQFATTLYNAAYFAAMTDVEHKEHSFYISRYPAAREATVFQNPDGSSVIDLKFSNDSDTGVAIQTIWTPSSITVKLWGTKRYRVESISGPRYDYASPPTITKGPEEPCTPVAGVSGFTTSDIRIIRDLNGNELRRTTRTVTYNPEPNIVCS
ncbi:VanW family protein [Prauserella oleivorans]|uniref:VanW family protein n=1 Tax=Prauserella oleivorans TaxID=1478153 RepID=A0ABW5W721_9PSEU